MTSAASVLFTFGPTASTPTSVWTMNGSVYWSLWERSKTAASNCWRWHDGFRESELSWRELLEDLKRQGLELPPKLAVGDGAMGFWAALRKVYPATREQRCWLHKMANVLNKLPRSMQGKAKQALRDIYLAESRQTAEDELDCFKNL